VKSQRASSEIKYGLSEVLKTSSMVNEPLEVKISPETKNSPVTPIVEVTGKYVRHGPQRSNAARRPRKKGRKISSKSQMERPSSPILIEEISPGQFLPIRHFYTVGPSIKKVHPDFLDVPRVLRESGYRSDSRADYVRRNTIGGSTRWLSVNAREASIRNQYGLRIDTMVPIIDEKVIDLSDQFNHYEWYKKEYHEWHNIPLDSVMETELRTLYSRVIYRQMVRYGGVYVPETNSYRLAHIKNDITDYLSVQACSKYTKLMLDHYLKLPLEEVCKFFSNEKLYPLMSWVDDDVD
jgi:hypothetical protein